MATRSATGQSTSSRSRDYEKAIDVSPRKCPWRAPPTVPLARMSFPRLAPRFMPETITPNQWRTIRLRLIITQSPGVPLMCHALTVASADANGALVHRGGDDVELVGEGCDGSRQGPEPGRVDAVVVSHQNVGRHQLILSRRSGGVNGSPVAATCRPASSTDTVSAPRSGSRSPHPWHEA